MAGFWDELTRALDGMDRSYSGMDRGWSRAGRGFSTGRLSSGWSGLRQAGRASKRGFNYSHRVVAAVLGALAAFTLFTYIALAILNPTPTHVSNAATEVATQDLPDPGVVVLEFFLAAVAFVGGFFVWKEYRKGKRGR